MKSFLEFLIEMSVTDAMKLFGINEVPSTKEELNKHFKKLALKHHPDLGGSEETMKLLNQAKELLDKNLGKSFTSYKSSRFNKTSEEREQAEKEYQERMEHVRSLIKKTFERFDANIYKEYLEKAFGITFIAKKNIVDNNYYRKNVLKLEFADKERDKVFELSFYIDEHQVYKQIYVVKSLDGSTDKTFEINMSSFVFIDGKKQVLLKDKFFSVNDPKIFTDPTILLPKTKISKLAKGEIRKDSKLAKRDFEGFFKAKYNAIIEPRNGEYYYFIPVYNGEYIIFMYRSKTLATPTYRLHEIGTKPNTAWKRYDTLKDINWSSLFTAVYENQEGMDFLKKALADFDKSGNYKKFVKDFQDFTNALLKKEMEK